MWDDDADKQPVCFDRDLAWPRVREEYVRKAAICFKAARQAMAETPKNQGEQMVLHGE